MSLLNMSFSATILILVIVIIRTLLLHKLPKKTFIVLWGVALCRLLIPFSIPSKLSVFTVADIQNNIFYDTNLLLTGVPVSSSNTAIIENMPTLPEAAPLNISLLPVIWFIGLLTCALFFLLTHLHCRREYRTALPVENSFIKCWQQKYSMMRKVQIRQSDKIAAPLTYGIFHPVVLLPKQIDWADEARLRYILLHEFVHIRRFDILTKLLMITALCIHWFNPLVWLMYLLAYRDVELSCDETVLETLGLNEKLNYALTLIGLEEKRSRLTSLVNNFSKNATRERVIMIMRMKKYTVLMVIVAAVLVIGITVGFATSRASSIDPATCKAMEAFNFDASNYIFIPDTYFSSENETETFSFTSDQIQTFANIFGDYLADAQKDSVFPDGIYVNESGTVAYLFSQKADGSYDMLKYEIENGNYENTEQSNYSTAMFESSDETHNLDRKSLLLYQLQQTLQDTISQFDNIEDAEVIFNTDYGTCTVKLAFSPEVSLTNLDIETIIALIINTSSNYIDLTADDIQIIPWADSADTNK